MDKEHPQLEGPLDNPELSYEQNRELDRATDQRGMGYGEAWRQVVGSASPEINNEVIQLAGEKAKILLENPKTPKSPKQKNKRIDEPSRRPQVYDRDKNAKDENKQLDPYTY